ncbi:hypothetical protein VNO77_42449 [Canavalia gladiata]|uniref:Uncharacterized protein n=1 Tax=Canavalia gladiata TaxID=3824 RepID=A0AAN9JSW0_CANGL
MMMMEVTGAMLPPNGGNNETGGLLTDTYDVVLWCILIRQREHYVIREITSCHWFHLKLEMSEIESLRSALMATRIGMDIQGKPTQASPSLLSHDMLYLKSFEATILCRVGFSHLPTAIKFHSELGTFLHLQRST